MDKRIKEDWVEALRSDEYVQGREYLERNNRYCCLGVLVDICDEGDDENGGECLSPDFRKKIGLTKHQEAVLMDFNDDYRATFEEIADWIDAKL